MKKSRLSRILNIIYSVLSFVAMMIVLDLIYWFSGLIDPTTTYVGYYVFKTGPALGFMISLGVMLFFIGLSMRFIYKAFESGEEITY